MYLVGIWVRSAVTSAIYRKALRVSQASKKEITTGEVVNLMSVDVQRLVDMMVIFVMVMLLHGGHYFFPVPFSHTST